MKTVQHMCLTHYVHNFKDNEERGEKIGIKVNSGTFCI